MRDNLHDYRKSYEKGNLTKSSVDPNPMQQFHLWFLDVEDAGGVDEVNAMTLATVGADDFPRGRVVLLKKYDENGFYFYSNYKSEKGSAIEHNNKVSLSFFWPNMERQVIVKGTAERSSREDSAIYFYSRPRESQLSALVSEQSSVVEDREALEARLKQLTEKYEGQELPMPKNWGGYLVRPQEFEFWQGRPNRLHDRIQYKLYNNEWTINRLQP